ncbi:MAG: DUF1800 domain-containing protein [Haliscomenobacter sp.]|nr:DUF1800 domain-containing protein [Haliscomenobacter sp.]MBK9488362.1 DUF1800 domain-containing protein [Haliscomenobacter sp.]
MSTIVNCAVGTLTAYSPNPVKPWDQSRVQHLYRRMGFGITPAEIKAALKRSPSELVDALVTEAMNMPLPPAPAWANLEYKDYKNFDQEIGPQYIEWTTRWMRDMYKNGFREKLALFWHNHFVTQGETYVCPSYLYAYHKILQQNCLGDFKAFVKAIGTTPAMLIYLNGVQNNRFSPNENYARELYELFTLGRDNGYTQQDIVETARALTGWNGFTAICAPIGYNPVFFDSGNKTIFGKTAAYNYDTLHDLLFQERAEQISTHICRKIYRHFVHPEVDETIVQGLAKTFRDNKFQLAPVFRQLFKSEHFFDDEVMGTIIKSPLELMISFFRQGGFAFEQQETTLGVVYLAGELGQQIFQPVDVAGWPGNRNWVNSATLTGRWASLDLGIYGLYTAEPESYRTLAKALSPKHDDPVLTARAIVDFWLPKGLYRDADYGQAVKTFKWEVPETYYTSGSWNLEWEYVPAQVALLIQHIARLPEFQLT